jgi:hypothetical protein
MPVLMKACGSWAVVEWDRYSVFSPQHMLQNMSLLVDLARWYLLGQPVFMARNEQLVSFLAMLLADSPQVQLTRSVFVPATKLLEAAERTVKGVAELPLRDWHSGYAPAAAASHETRATNINFLLMDYTNVCTADGRYLPRVVPGLLAVAGLGFYELQNAFMGRRLNAVSVELLSSLVRSAKLFVKNSEVVSRYFTFNAAAGDAKYLSELHEKFTHNQRAFEWQEGVDAQVAALLSGLSLIDLEDFDKGVRLEFTPWLRAHADLAWVFNKLKLVERVSFLQPVMEHLEQVRGHIALLSDPAEVFAEVCPLHSLWGVGKSLELSLGVFDSGPVSYERIREWFDFYGLFNQDGISLGLLAPRHGQTIWKTLEVLVDDVASFVRDRIKGEMKRDSATGALFTQTTGERFRREDFMPWRAPFNRDKYHTIARAREVNSQLRALLMALPENVVIGSKPMAVREKVRDLRPVFLEFLGLDTPNPREIERTLSIATQVLWPFYTIVGQGFPRLLFDFRVLHSGVTKQEMITVLRSESAIDKQKTLGDAFVNNIKKIIGTDCLATVIAPYAPRREVQFFVDSFCIRGAIAVDHACLSQAAQSITTVLVQHARLASDLASWGEKQDWSILERKELEATARELVKAGAALHFRAAVRLNSMRLLNSTSQGLVGDELVTELSTTGPFWHFLVGHFGRFNFEPANPVTLMTQLALALGTAAFTPTQFSPISGAIQFNLHFVPNAISAIMANVRVCSGTTDWGLTIESSKAFFKTLQAVSVRARSAGNTRTADILVVIADLTAASLAGAGVEYGRAAAYFPRGAVNEAYSALGTV